MKTNTDIIINVEINNENFNIILQNNPTTTAFLKKLPLEIDMDDLYSNEKYYYFNEKLPTNSEVVRKICSGDLMLFGTNCLVLFYKSISSAYSYTRLGYIEDTTKLTKVLGCGTVRVKLSKEKQ